MRVHCPKCQGTRNPSENRFEIVRYGQFYRRSDSRRVQRFYCKRCEFGFSRATLNPCYRQNKRQFNDILRKLLCSGVSQRRASRILNLDRKTVVRKFLFLSIRAALRNQKANESRRQSSIIEFDDLETFEHTKCKPLSVTMAVEHGSRFILGFEVSRMPAKGKLASISRKKYGYRLDERPLGRQKLFSSLGKRIHPRGVIKSDENPHYPKDVRKYFPDCEHQAFKGRRGCVVGQGELKKIGFDPLFSLNHTYATLRADINRLFRRTWCTTKKPERLKAHLHLYVDFHNTALIARAPH